MKIIVAKDYEELSKKAAEIIGDVVCSKPDCVLGLATGSSPLGTYRELIAKYQAGKLDFANVKSANLDEYVGLNRSHKQSYYSFMRDNFFSSININLDNTYIPNGENPDAEAECAKYDGVIEELGGVDIQLLGIGHNGHIGFNEPASCFSKGTNCVELQESTINANTRFFASKDEVPTRAYTMGIGSIMKAKKVLLIASGKDKAEIVAKFAKGDITPNVPASILQYHNDVIVVVDAEAGALL